MAKSFKFRYVNEIVGSFVLATVVLILLAVVMIAFSHRWFTSSQTVVLRIPGGLSTDLRPGTDVVIGGTVAGSVEYTHPDPVDPSTTIATLTVPSDFMASVHQDSRIEIRRSLGGVGDAFVRISGGTGPRLANGASITMDKENIESNPAEMAQQILREVAVPMLQNLNKTINDPHGNLQEALAHANHIVASVDQGQGVAGRLINDQQLATQVAEILPRLNASLESVQHILADTQKTTAQLPQLAGSLNSGMSEIPGMLAELHSSIKRINAITGDIQQTTASLPKTTIAVNQTMEQLPGLVLQTQETLRQLQRLLEGAQRSWLLRAYVEKENPAGARIGTDRVAP